MGNELWTSPITGYRRKGTRLSELRSVLGARIDARAILEPIQCCPANALATEMRDLLGRRGFDVAGVMNDPTGPVIRICHRKRTFGRVSGEPQKAAQRRAPNIGRDAYCGSAVGFTEKGASFRSHRSRSQRYCDAR